MVTVVTVGTVGTVVVVVMVVVAMIALKAAGAAVVARAMAAIARQATQTVQHHKKLWAKKRRFFPGLYVWEPETSCPASSLANMVWRRRRLRDSLGGISLRLGGVDNHHSP